MLEHLIEFGKILAAIWIVPPDINSKPHLPDVREENLLSRSKLVLPVQRGHLLQTEVASQVRVVDESDDITVRTVESKELPRRHRYQRGTMP